MTTIQDALLARRPHKRAVVARVKRLGRQLARQTKRYRGGLPAEVQSVDLLRRQTARLIRRELFSRRGRPIDLVALLRQRRPDGMPVWCLADPRYPLGEYNGAWRWPHKDSPAVAVALCNGRRIEAGNGGPGAELLRPSGMPALPRRVRSIVNSPLVTRHASMVGVLYQPDEWQQLHPDPALIVEWRDLPGQYYALAIWGGDRARIAEYVS